MSDKKETEGTQGGSSSSSTSQCNGLWGGEGFRDYSQGGCQSGRGGDETLQDSGHAGLSRCLSQGFSKSPPLQRRKVLVMCKLFSGIFFSVVNILNSEKKSALRASNGYLIARHSNCRSLICDHVRP